MRVLYVSHTDQVSGGERSLLDLLGALDEHVQPTVATATGDLSAALGALDVPTRIIPRTSGSLKPHPVHTPRAVSELIRAAWSVRRIADRDDAELVHANSIRAGLVAVAAARMGAPPAVVHVRDVLPDSALTRLTRAAIGSGASAIVGNSAHTLDKFAGPRSGATLAVAHSPVDLDRLSSAASVDPGQARVRLGIAPNGGPVLGVVAQITPWKAQDDAVRIVARLRLAHPGIRLLLVGSAKFVGGSTRHDNAAFLRRLWALVEDLDLQDRVVLLGERPDVPEVLRALDMLLVPSWEEPFGRSVVEGLAVGVPVAATSIGGPREVISDGVEGVLLPPRRPAEWVKALSPLLGDRNRLAEMARAGRARSAAFDSRAHAYRVLSVYREVLDGPRRRRAPRAQSHLAGRARSRPLVSAASFVDHAAPALLRPLVRSRALLPGQTGGGRSR
jgi:L-malate glycosyltransferase